MAGDFAACASVCRSERWGNSSAYLTGLSLPTHLCGPAKRGGRPAAAAAVSNLLLRIVSAPLRACVSELAVRTRRGWTPVPGAGPNAVPRPRDRAPQSGPRPHPPLTWAAAARGCAHSGCERDARRCSRGRRRAGRRCRATAARGSWLRALPGSAPGAKGAGGRDRLAVSAARRLGPRPRAHQHRPHRSAPPPPARPRPGHADPPTTSPPPASALRTRPRTATPSLRPSPSRHAVPAQSKKYSPITTSLSAQTLRPRPFYPPLDSDSAPKSAPPRTRCPGNLASWAPAAQAAAQILSAGSASLASPNASPRAVPGLFLSRANLLKTLSHPSRPRLTLTVPKHLPGTLAPQS